MTRDPKDPSSATGRGEAGRRAILDAAMFEFAEHGFDGARTRAIANRAGQNLATLHYHFGTKEKLYVALAHAFVALIRPCLEGLWERANTVVGDQNREDAAKLFRELLETLFDTIVADERTMPLSRVIIREQMQPSAVFEVVYEGVLGPMHTALTRLLATALNRDPLEPQTIAQAHALLGQVFAFRAARATVLHRTGWKCIGPSEAGILRAALRANLSALFAGFSQAQNNF